MNVHLALKCKTCQKCYVYLFRIYRTTCYTSMYKLLGTTRTKLNFSDSYKFSVANGGEAEEEHHIALFTSNYMLNVEV